MSLLTLLTLRMVRVQVGKPKQTIPPAKVAGGGRYTVGHTLDLYEGYQVTNAIRCVSLTSHKGSNPLMKGKTMLFIIIMAVVAVVFIYAVIDKQYKIDQEDWDFRDER